MNTVGVLRPGGRARAVAGPPARIVAAGVDRAVTVTATRTDVVRVSAPGPQGPPGRDGAVCDHISFTGSRNRTSDSNKFYNPRRDFDCLSRVSDLLHGAVTGPVASRL